MPIRVYRLLLKALRRWLFKPDHLGGNTLDTAWVGLGTYSVYKPAIEAGLMTYVHEPNPKYVQWWKLTPQGAKIVQHWIDEGVRVENYEVSNPPPVPNKLEYKKMLGNL